MVKILLLIGSGSFLGGVFRYLISKSIQSNISSAFPFGTFAVNIIGCFLIGLFFGISERTNFLSDEMRIFLTVGFCGGFTTFSTFANENIALLRDGDFFHFILYTLFSVFLCLMATYFGNLITKI